MQENFQLTNARSAKFSDAEFDMLAQSTWSVDCCSIELKQRCEGGRCYSGVGHLSQDQEGQVRYKIYVTKSENTEDNKLRNPGVPGTLIPETDYYDLTMADVHHRIWKGERILPGVFQHMNGMDILSGRLDEITCEGEIPQKVSAPGSNLSCYVFEKIDIPINAKSSLHRHIAGLHRQRQFKLNCWKFRAAKSQFLLFNDENERLNIHVSSDAHSLPDHLSTRVLEALFFVLGRPIHPTVITQRSLHQTRCTLYSRRLIARNARHQPPLAIRLLTDSKTNRITVEPYNKLFRQYLKYGLNFEGHHPPLWAQLNAVYEASAGAFIDAYALTLCVAIESILNSEFGNVAKPTQKQIDTVDAALKHLKDWQGDNAIKQRIKGSVSSLKSSRAGDKLNLFKDQGIISAKAVKAWTILRNKNAHEYQNNSLQEDKFRECLQQVNALFYQLIFHAIKYRGPYNDHGTAGWPVRQFP